MWILQSLLISAFAALAAVAAPTAGQTACGKLTIAEMTWASAAVAAHMEKIILQKAYGCEVELVPGDTVPTSTSMGIGSSFSSPTLMVPLLPSPPLNAATRTFSST